MRRVILAALALTACIRDPAPAPGFRDPGTAISSSAAFDSARFAGRWHGVAAFGAEAACGRTVEDWQADAAGFAIRGTACGKRGLSGFATRGQVVGPGRVARAEAGGTEVLWILWVDADYRIAAIGTPSGAIGRILSRDPVPRADLLTAAREILDFNGYDISRLQMLR